MRKKKMKKKKGVKRNCRKEKRAEEMGKITGFSFEDRLYETSS